MKKHSQVALACAVSIVACANGAGREGWQPSDPVDGAAASTVIDAGGGAADARTVQDAPPGSGGDGQADAEAADGQSASSADGAAGGCPPSCSYGCTNGGCNLSCGGDDANCAKFPSTYCDWQGAWECVAYRQRGQACGTSYDPKCLPSLTCKHLDSNGNYSAQPTCQP